MYVIVNAEIRLFVPMATDRRIRCSTREHKQTFSAFTSSAILESEAKASCQHTLSVQMFEREGPPVCLTDLRSYFYLLSVSIIPPKRSLACLAVTFLNSWDGLLVWTLQKYY